MTTINTHVLQNGDKLYWIGDSMVKVTDRGYVCYQSNRHCFARGTHEKIIKLLGIEHMNNLTSEEFYFHRKTSVSK
jgi:hypothetical protein